MTDFPTAGGSVGRYTIGERIGQGGSGAVFRATRTMPRREVALKVLPSYLAETPGFREQFLHEADVLTELNSPHIVAIHDVGEEDGFLFIATDLITGGDLATRLSRGPVPLKPALIVASQIALALSAAHQSGIVHGDVKPTNVLLSQRDAMPHAYLCDFGTAQLAGAGGTRRNVVTGTYAYLAPELIAGGAASAASDIYALGCLLVAAITGTPPYQGTDQEIAQQHLTSQIPHWEETSPLLGRLNELVRTSLAKDPARRYRSAEAFREAIGSVLSEVPDEPPSVEPVADPVPVAEPRPTPDPVPVPVPDPVPVADSRPTPDPVPEPEPEPEPAADEANEQTQVRMAPITAELLTPDEQEQPAPEPAKRREWLLISSLLALVLIGATIALLVLLRNDADDNGDRTNASASANPSTSPVLDTPTPSPTPGQKKTCLDGREIAATQRCGEPRGIDGLHVVFSDISGDCTEERLTTATKDWEIACELGGQDAATVTYSTYRTTAVGRTINDELFPDTFPIMLPSGLLRFGPEQTPSGRWQVGLTYFDKHPYGVLIVADSSRVAQRIAGQTAATMLPEEQFTDEGQP